MTYKVLSSLTANNVNSADLLKVKTDLLIIAVNKKTLAAAELKGLQASAQSLVKESIKEINSGSRKSIFLPAPAKVAAKNILLIGLGKHKSKAVADVVEGPLSAFCPGSALQNHLNATIVLDKLAASDLKLYDYYIQTEKMKTKYNC